MGDIKLFRIDGGIAVELEGAALALGKPLQVLIEHNMEALFGVRFVATVASTRPARSTAASALEQSAEMQQGGLIG